MRATRYTGNEEATIDELLGDPIAELLRRRDQLTVEQVLDCIDEAKRKLSAPASYLSSSWTNCLACEG